MVWRLYLITSSSLCKNMKIRVNMIALTMHALIMMESRYVIPSETWLPFSQWVSCDCSRFVFIHEEILEWLWWCHYREFTPVLRYCNPFDFTSTIFGETLKILCKKIPHLPVPELILVIFIMFISHCKWQICMKPTSMGGGWGRERVTLN